MKIVKDKTVEGNRFHLCVYGITFSPAGPERPISPTGPISP